MPNQPSFVTFTSQPGRSSVRHGCAGKNRFVADQRQHLWRARHGHCAAAVAGDKPAAHLGELLQTRSLEQILQRQIFAERHQMHLVVDAEDRAVVVDHINRIICACDALARRRFAARIAPVMSTVPGGSSSAICASASGSRGQKKRKSGLRPDQMRDVAHAARLRAGGAVGEPQVAAPSPRSWRE